MIANDPIIIEYTYETHGVIMTLVTQAIIDGKLFEFYHWTQSETGEPHHVDCVGQCDCCERMKPLTQCWLGGLETWACDECRGDKE